MPNPKVKQIYDTLKEGGADVGSEKEFNDYFFAKGKDGYNNRKAIFDTLKEGGADAGDTYEDFAGWLGLHAVRPEETAKSAASATSVTTPISSSNRQTTRKGTSMTDAEKASMISNVGGFVRNSQAGLQRSNNMITYAKKKTGLCVDPVSIGHNPNVVETVKQYNPRTGKIQARYLTETGNEYDDKVQAGIEQTAIDEQKRRELDPVQSQLEDAYSERERLEKAVSVRRKELEDDYKSKPWYQRALMEMGKAAHSDLDPAATAADSEHMGFEQDKQYMQLMAAIRKNHQTIQTLEDKKNGQMNSFWHSLGTALTNGYTFADGLPELRDATAMLNAQKHIDSINRKRQTGQTLTKEEEAAEAVLHNTQTDNAIQGAYGSEYGAWGRAGSGMAQSIDFMKDFLLLPGAGSIAKGVAGKVAKVGGSFLAKKAGESAVKATAKAIARATLKATGVVAGAHTAGAVISNTTGIGRTAAKMGQLSAGDVSMDENGNYKIENQQDLMSAFVEAEREQAGENGSEMFGEFIPGGKVLSAASKKALSKIGLGRISDMLTSIGNKAWYKNYTTLLSKGGYNGIPGEALEEYEGMFFDAITGHADEAIQEFTDPKQQVDIWLGCATMGALMGAIPMGLHVQGYYRYKHGMNRADKTADFRLTPEKWQPLKEQIDQTDNGNMSEFVVDNILNNNNLETQEKEAALDYVRNLTKFRGFNIAQVNNADEAARETQAAGVDPQNEERRQHDEYRQEAYEMGRNAASVVEAEGDRSDADAIVLRQREAYDEIERVFADDAEMRLAQLEDDPWEVMNDQSLTPEQQDAVAYFVNSKAAMDGLNDAVIENSENKGDEVARQIEKRTNKQSGMIHPATLKADDKQVYIVSGSVSMFADGSAVDIQNSSESIVVCDAETGELKFMSPEQINKVDEPVEPSVELKAADETIKAERQAIWGDTEETPEQIDSDQSHQQDVANEETNYEEQNESEENIPQSEPVLQDNIDSEVNLPHNEADTHEVSALSRIPKGEQGEPLLEQTDPETAWDGVVEYMENADDAQEYVESMVGKLAKDVDNATKAVSKIKPTGDIAQFKADKAAARQVQAAAEARLEQWKQIANVNVERKKAEKAVEQEQRAVREAEIHQQAVKAEELRQHEELQKQAEQDARGANNVAPAIREKWDLAPKINGAPNEIVLPNGERVNGHYVLTESGAASPSHNATAEFVKTEGFPIDENGQSVNDRDYERDKDAQNVTRNIARNYDSRAMQSPVVVSKDGVVLSGNGRTMAGELAAANNTDGAYIEHLQKYPQQFGFTPEQVQGMQHPRVVFVPDADMPYNAETFAKFNQQEMKAQSKTEQAVKLGKIVDDATLAHITRAINSYETLGEFYADHKATRAAIRELQAAGVLSQAQIAEMFDGEGISAQGKEVLENMLIGKAFESNPDAIREITEFKSVRQSVITALAEIINNKSLGDDYSLEHELSQAVDLVYKARKANHKAGDRVSSYARQQNLFTFDEGDTVADYTNSVMLMLADVLNDSRSTRLKKILAVYNDKAAYSAVGQTDMFTDGGIQNKEQIWNDVKQLIDYGTETEQQQAISEATERRKESVREDESFGRSDERSGEIADVKLSDEVDEDGSPFIETSHGSTIFGEIKKESGLTPAPIKLSLGNSKYGLIHIEKRHGDQIRNAGFISVEEFVEFVCKNYKQIKQGENSLGENNGTYLIQIEDEHNNTLYVELSTDNKYWSVNSGGVFRKGYGKNKKEVWSASEVQSKQSATNSTLREEELSDKPTTPNGNVPTTSMGKDSQTSETKQEKEDKFTPSAKKEGENIIDYATRVIEENDAYKARKAEEARVNTSPTNAQKEAGNYKKGHIRVDGLDITIEQPKGSIRRGKDADGKEWESKMHNTYGYIRGTEGVDGDHIDIYLSDNPAEGNVFVIDQVNNDGSFDEHKVMYGFPDRESAKQAYLSNYEDGWQGLGNITEVSKEDFKKWVDSSTRKTKPFAEYKSIKVEEKKSSKDLYNKEKEVSLQSNSSENENSRRDSQGTGRNRPEKLGENDAIGLRLESAGRESEKTTGGSLIQRVDREQVEAERLASEYGALFTIDDLFGLGNIGPSGTESDTYFSPDGYVYKMNNLMHNPLISDYLKRLSLHNKIFTNTPYELVGFVKSGRSIYPVVRQAAVDFDRLATDEEIVSYMQSLGFTPDGNGRFHNNEYTVEDVKPKNVFMGKDRQVYVIDAEIFVKNELDTERTRSEEKNGRKIQGFEDYSEEEIIDALKGDVEMILEDSGIDDVEIKDVAIHGSRARGTAREDSDLDVVVEYSGDWKEDSLFNVLHEDEHTFEGIKVDFNPIRVEESGSMQNYMKRSAAYDKDQLEKVAVAHISEEIMHDDIPAMTEEEYLASKGLASPMTDYTLDKTRIPHGETARQEARRKREAEKVIEEYAAQKETARKEYRKKIANGELREPTKEEAEQKRIDVLIKTANGHEDNPSVQAARRVLAKRGIEWKKNEDAFARAEQIAQDAANLKEMETYRKHTDTSSRTAMDEDKFDSENLYAPLTLDGKPSKLAVMTVVPGKITDPTGQIAVYDYSDEIDNKTNDGWQKWSDIADEYNKTADANDKAHERGDEASLGFASIDAAVKFNDWLKERDNGNDTVTPASTVNSKDKASDFADGTTVAGKVVAQTKESVTIEQNGRRYDIRAKDLIEQSDELIAAPKREYQKGNHVSANTTTKRRLATDAVLSLLDKAGVPVEIVSDETAKEIIPENAEKRIVYHGSSSKFEQFDHSHMGEGEGAQAYGWGSYVTEVEGIGRSYAVGNGKIKFRGFVLESMHSLEVKEHFSEAERKVLNFLYKWVKRSDNVSTAIEKAREWASNEYGKYSGRRDWSDQNYKDYFGAISKRDVSEWRKEMKEKEENAQQMLSFIETVSVDDFSLPQRHLYTVDIPDDTGSNYLSWEQPMTVEQLNAIEAYLKENFRANRVQVFTDGITKSTASNSEEVDAFTRRGENIYHLLEHILYDDKSVSEMLHSLGYTGISYPAEHQSGGREDGARNYVVFNEKDLKVTDHVQFMKTPQGTVYGWTVGGKIYLTKAGLNPETPIHEYTHIWANAMRVHNAEGWNSIKDLLKDTPVWVQVLNDPNYSDIKDDEDAVASEVLSRISGKENAKKFEEQANQMLEQTHGILEKARVTTLINNVRRALNKFWSWVGKNLFAIEKFGSIDEITDRVLYDLVNATPLQTDAARDKAEMQVGREENIDAVNARFNEELEQQITGKQEAGHVYELGMPGEVLQSTGVPFVPIQMNATRLAEKATRFGHDFDLSEIKDLVKSIQQPLAIFSYGNKDKAQNIVVEIQHENKNFIVGLSLRPTIYGRILEINSIRNVFPKDNAEWLNWITQGKLLYADKEKIQALINQQRTILADVDYLDLDSAANIVKDFVNPNIGEEKTSLQGKIVPQDTTPQAKALQAKVLSEKLNTPIRVVSDPEVIAELPSRRQQRAKGWWSTKNDEVVILLPNNTDAADVANTAVHEVVGHKGLRKLIGEERFDEFLNEVYDHATNPIRTAIDEAERKLFDTEVDRLTQQKNAEADRPESRKGVFSRAEATVEANKKREQMRREATEEYMADMAGRIGDDGFEKMSAEELTFWGKVKAKVQQFLDKFLRGLKIAKGIKLTDKDVAYILYKSWKNMRNGGKPTIVDMAEDAMIRNKTYYNEADLVRFRDGNSVEYNKALARDLYEQRIKRGLYQTQEAIQDSMLSLKEAMRAILKAEGSNIDKIEDVADYENPYLGENRLSSVNQAECSAFAQTLFKPMLEEVASLTNNATERSELIDYMMAKHGLERNDVMAMRFANSMTNEKYSKQLNEAERTVAADPLDQDAKDALDDLKQRIQDYRDILYAENRGVDYAGLTALTGMDNVTDAENEANKMVSEYEANHDTTNLWAMINAVTKATLQKTYESGIISKVVYDDISNMYKNYIPLRGFDETTSEEAYAYLSDTNGAFNAPIKTAKGRTSKADDPFANMEAMAESAIMQGNRNILVKRKFMRFAQNHPSDLVSINDLWLRYDDVSGEWRPVNTGDIKGTEFIEENDTPADVERKMRDFETAIQQLSITDPDHFKRQKDYPNIPYRVVGDRDLRQHQVLIKQGGKDYILTINGNPRVAQALNGLTNPDNDTSGALGAILHLSEAINRQLSAFYTTRNPDFIVSNFMRDMLYANTMVWVKESPNYALNFHKNFAKLNPVMMKSLLTKLRNGTLDMNNETEKAFSLFIANGGETGYANIRDIEQRKNDIKRELRKHNGKLPIAKALSILGERFDEYNRAVENCARFAAFITSYKMKRSIGRCVYDAKEISVNFNKKGSGAKFMGKTGQSKSGNVAAFVSGFGRSSYVFWNAAIQGTTNFGRQFKRHPEKAIAGAAAMFLLGAIVAWLEGDSDDKDGKNNYYDLPEYTRRSNIIFRIPGMDSWISIPLPVEYRALYGMGELMTGVIGDKEHYTTGELSSQIAGQVSQALPIDFMEGGGGFKAFVPSSIKPYAEVMTNKSWTGMPIYKETPWNKDMPEWTKAYKSANKQLVGLSKVLNEVSGGDDYTSGMIDINPAQVEYLLNGYFGGVSSTIDKFAKMGETALGQREYDPRSFLVVNRLVKSSDERTKYRHINNEYFRLKEEHNKLKTRLKHYIDDTSKGVFDYAEKINWINKSPEYQRLLIFEKYSSDINAINKELKETIDEESRKKLEALNYQLKQAMVDEANKTRK